MTTVSVMPAVGGASEGLLGRLRARGDGVLSELGTGRHGLPSGRPSPAAPRAGPVHSRRRSAAPAPLGLLTEASALDLLLWGAAAPPSPAGPPWGASPAGPLLAPAAHSEGAGCSQADADAPQKVALPTWSPPLPTLLAPGLPAKKLPRFSEFGTPLPRHLDPFTPVKKHVPGALLASLLDGAQQEMPAAPVARVTPTAVHPAPVLKVAAR